MNKKAFTLVEIIVAITIFLIVMVSILQIFWISNELTNKIDINRQIQENIKNFTETLAEDIRKYWISWAWNNWIIDNYTLTKWNWLKLNNNTKYYIWEEISWTLARKSDINSCKDLKNNCFIVKEFPDWTKAKITNSWVAFENLEFNILWNNPKKVIINFIARPATKKWIRANLIKNSKIIFQTTLSERFIKTN